MRTLIAVMMTVVLVGCQAGSSGAEPENNEDALLGRARAIHAKILTIDTHDDIPSNFATAEVDPGVRGDRQVDLPKMREGGLDTGFFVVYVGQSERTAENYVRVKKQAEAKFDSIRRMANEMYPDEIVLAYTPDEVEAIHRDGKLVACIGIENGYAIGKDLNLLEKYYGLGARYMTLTHGGHNDIGDSATPSDRLGDQEAEHNGLSEFGREVVAEMNRLGMLVDISHVSKQTMLDAALVSKAPIVASHSGVRAICNHPRNLDDEQLLALKKNGGVVQTVALGSFVKETPPERRATLRAAYGDFGIRRRSDLDKLDEQKRAEFDLRMQDIDEKWPPATVQDYVDHIDYAVNLIGIDHVGISSDFDGGGGVVGWNDASETFNVTLELVRRGYTEEDIAKLWGGNFLRVWREADQVAKKIQGSV